jgi:putative endonuclease
MEYFAYIIYSVSRDKFYVGSTQNLEKRVADHNNSRSGYTKGTSDWSLKWDKKFSERSEAIRFELMIKKKKSRKYIEILVSSQQ